MFLDVLPCLFLAVQRVAGCKYLEDIGAGAGLPVIGRESFHALLPAGLFRRS